VVTRQLKRIEIWLFAWLLALSWCQLADGPGWLQSLTIFPFGSLFVGGCWLYRIREHGVSHARTVGLAWALLLSLAAAAPEARDFIHGASPRDVLVAQGLVALSYGMILVVALRRFELSNARLAITLGALTYPLYLVHNRIGKLIYQATEGSLPPAVRVILMTAVALLLAWLINELVERRGVRFLRGKLGLRKARA
jgi:peptidoglycan/LPS O-acetylase OafA/YrhL